MSSETSIAIKTKIIELLSELTPEDRITLFYEYFHCGKKDPSCSCEEDE